MDTRHVDFDQAIEGGVGGGRKRRVTSCEAPMSVLHSRMALIPALEATSAQSRRYQDRTYRYQVLDADAPV